TLPPTKGASPRRGSKPLQMIDYGPDEQLVDHKGRSKPLYKPRSPKPASWKPSKPVRMLLGLIPGVRLMIAEGVREGAPYAVFGVLALVTALFLIIGIPRTVTNMHALLMDGRWILAQAAGIVMLLFVYEILR